MIKAFNQTQDIVVFLFGGDKGVVLQRAHTESTHFLSSLACASVQPDCMRSMLQGWDTPLSSPQAIKKAEPTDSTFFACGGTESRKNAHSIISDKQNGILLPSRFAAIRLSAIRQTISRKPGLMPCRRLAPRKRLSLRLYRSALTAVLLVPYLAANRHIYFCFRR